MDRGAWRAAVHGVAESDTTEQLNHQFSNPRSPIPGLVCNEACSSDQTDFSTMKRGWCSWRVFPGPGPLSAELRPLSLWAPPWDSHLLS